MKKLMGVFRLALTVIIVFIVLLSYFTAYRPLKLELERQMLNQFVLMVEATDKTAEQFILRSVEGAAGISSRSAIRQLLSDYFDGNATLDQVKSYTEPRYIDGLNALDGVIAAWRVTDAELIVFHGDRYSELEYNKFLLSENNGGDLEYGFTQAGAEKLLIVNSPVIQNSQVLAVDILVFSLEELELSLNNENMAFAISSSENCSHGGNQEDAVQIADGQTVYMTDNIVCHLWPINDTGWFLEASMTREALFAPVDDASRVYMTVFAIAAIFLISGVQMFVYFYTRRTVHRLEMRKDNYKRKYSFDQLTGALSRSFYEEMLKNDLRIVDRDYDNSSLVMLDIDCFKQINDTLGHQAGDEALKAVAGILTRSCRENDHIIRFGGDEFLVCFHDCSVEAADLKMRRIEKILLKEAEIAISYGVVAKEYKTIDEAVQIADQKMYEAKKIKKLKCADEEDEE
jgi:diguanylate cyclase (GGDEF)-like protein